MKPSKVDLSVFDKFDFRLPPVGVNFLFEKPEGMDRSNERVALCAMVKKAQQTNTAFYADLDSHGCLPGTYILGHDLPGPVEGGYLGVALKAFKSARANRRVYEVVPRFKKGTINYIAFSPLEKLMLEPDLLIVVTDSVRQTEVLLRAASYSTGKALISKMTNVLGCGWLFAYPYLTGEINYITAGLGFGMRVQEAFPEGHQVLSIPHEWLLTIVDNLAEMAWVPPSFEDETHEFDKQVFAQLGLKIE
jgi:uncharacterized protein (DUF169 family)